MQKNKFRIIIACISILSLMLILCGTSLSLFEFTKQGTTENVVKAGTLSVYFTESTGTGMGINISDAYPVSDSIGKNYLNSDQIFDFTITGENTSNNEIPFEITLEKLENSDLDNNAVKVYLTDITEENQEIEIDEPMLYSDLYDSVFKINNDEKVIYQDKVESNETYNKKFRLRMWLSDSIDFEHGNYDNKTFETIINIHSDDKNGITKIYRCDYEIGHTWDFDYTGSEQEFTVPCEGTYKIETWGAQGGSNGYLGGYSSGNISLITETNLFVYVGQYGQLDNYSWNGGGFSPNVTNNKKYGGGGATDIRFFENNNPSPNDLLWDSSLGLNSRIMVAGAGGAATTYHLNTPTLFGVGGGLIGGHINDGYDSSGYGGTQTSGGRGGSILNGNHQGTGGNGSFGKGGNGTSHAWAGGSGYYGGGGGSRNTLTDGGGGGGSSFISGHNGCDAISRESTSSNIIHTGQPNHYSGLVFNETVMIDGDGYNWTNVKESYVGQPQPDGTVTTGHTGNGYARITLINTK